MYEVYTEAELFNMYGYLLSKEYGRNTELLLKVLQANGVNIGRIGDLFYINKR